MSRIQWSLLLASIHFCLSLSGDSYDLSLVNTSLWLASSAYCSPDTYLSRKYPGYAAEFVATHRVQVPADTTEGVVGYVPRLNAIFIAFRGSETLENWIDDLSFGFVDYPFCEACEVHTGFYSAHQAAMQQVTDAVVDILKQKPFLRRIVVTGHSLGGALATLTALDLKSANFGTVYTITFGSPRIG
jgi:predicted lipase